MARKRRTVVITPANVKLDRRFWKLHNRYIDLRMDWWEHEKRLRRLEKMVDLRIERMAAACRVRDDYLRVLIAVDQSAVDTPA